MKQKIYILQKDYPYIKKGEEIMNDGNDDYYRNIITKTSIHKEYVENNPDFFKLKEEEKLKNTLIQDLNEMSAKLQSIRNEKYLNGNDDEYEKLWMKMKTCDFGISTEELRVNSKEYFKVQVDGNIIKMEAKTTSKYFSEEELKEVAIDFLKYVNNIYLKSSNTFIINADNSTFEEYLKSKSNE